MFRHRKNKQYRTIKRINRWLSRLTERSFCLDINVLSRLGFFKGGRGTRWDYACKSEIASYMGDIFITPWNSEHEEEYAIYVDHKDSSPVEIIRARYERHPLCRWRYWLICPDCGKRKATLFIPLGRYKLACRECHELVYVCQMRGYRRVGHEEYSRLKVMYKVSKTLEVCS